MRFPQLLTPGSWPSWGSDAPVWLANLPYKDPLSEQCPARSKRSGRRCKNFVRGGGPCNFHGGKAARQVKAKREQRLIILEAQQREQAQAHINGAHHDNWTASPGRSDRLAEELIINAMHDADEVLQLIKAQVVAGVSPALTLPMLGEWADRVARIGKVVTDGQLQDKFTGRRRVLDEQKAQELATVMKHALAAIGPTDQQLAAFGPAMMAAMSSPDIEPISLSEFMSWLAEARARVRSAEDATV